MSEDSMEIGRYKVLEELGSGGFSTVYRVEDTVLGREVALKVMRPLLLSDHTFVQRFQREARVMAGLDHPHIIPIYDYGEFEDRLCLVMKLLPGGSVGALTVEGALPWERVVAITEQVAGALDYAHERGLVHRDVKPHNVLLDEEGQAVLADFGLVRALEAGTITSSLSGGILGTPAYVPPEIWNAEEATPATDVYALACVVFYMATGTTLFDAPTPPATMALHFRAPQFPEAWPEGVPPEVEEVLERALAREPAERYASAGAFAEALTALAADPLAEPYAALEEAVAAERWQDALTLAERIMDQAPGYRETRALLARAMEGNAAAERESWATQWREATEAALAAEEWEHALSAARKWQEFAPEDEGAAAAVARAEAALATSAVAEEEVPVPPAPEREPIRKTPSAERSRRPPAGTADTARKDAARPASGLLERVPPWALWAAPLLLVALVVAGIVFSNEEPARELIEITRAATPVVEEEAEEAAATPEPADEPTDEPNEEPTDEPTEEPAEQPTEEVVVEEPTEEPSRVPENDPTSNGIERCVVADDGPFAGIDPRGQEIAWWHPHGGSREERLISLAGEFNRLNACGITVDPQLQGGYADIRDRITASIVAGDLPAALIVGYQFDQALLELNEALVDLDDYIHSEDWGLSDESLGAFYSRILEGSIHPSFDNQQLGIPAFRAMQVLYYNQTWLEELGFDGPPETPEQFREMACAAAEERGDGTGGFIINTGASSLASWTFAFGGDVLAEDGTSYNYDGEATVEALAFIKDLYDDGCGYIFTEGFPDPEFAARRAIFTESSSSGLPFYESNIQAVAEEQGREPDEWGVAAIPHTTTDPVQNVYGADMVVTETTPEQQLAAWIFIKWFTMPEVQARWIEISDYLPTRRDTAEHLAEYQQDNPQWAMALDLLEYGAYEPQLISYPSVRIEADQTFEDVIANLPENVGLDNSESIRQLLRALTEFANDEQANLME